MLVSWMMSGVVRVSSLALPCLSRLILLVIVMTSLLWGRTMYTGHIKKPSPPEVVPIMVAKPVCLQKFVKPSAAEYTVRSISSILFAVWLMVFSGGYLVLLLYTEYLGVLISGGSSLKCSLGTGSLFSSH